MRARRFLLAPLLLAVTIAFAASPAAAQIPATSDPVIYWNDIAARTATGPAPAQARAIAIMNAAVHDAVARTYGEQGNFYTTGVTAPGGNTRAAAAVAAHRVLVSLYPANAVAYNDALAASLAQIRNGPAKTNGIATGTNYAAATLARRASDGASAAVDYAPGSDPGEWRPTPNGYMPAAVPQWGGVTPFLMTSGAQFRPGPPPALNSDAYRTAYDEVKAIGSSTSTTRTEEQTASALFWDISNGTTWIRIGNEMLATDGLTIAQNSRIMAKLSAGVADSLIAGFDAKYTYNLWRPVTAIRKGDADTNPLTVGDAEWSPLFNTPAHPSYLSTHSLQSGAASTILLSLIEDRAFCTMIGSERGCFSGLGAAAEDAANSRLWGGIHFRFDNELGLASGRDIGRWALDQRAFAGVPEPATWMMMIGGFGMAGAALRRRRGAPRAAIA